MMKSFFVLGILMVLVLGADALADVPQTISYQGVLKDNTGTIVPDDDYDFTFRIYNVETDGTALWTENQTKHVTAGILNVILGEVTPIDLPFDEQYWLGVSIGAGPEAVPRTKLTGAPYSLNAQAVRGDHIFPQSGNVGIGITEPSYPLHVVADDIHGIRLDGTVIGSWSLLEVNAAGIGSSPGIEYLKTGTLKAMTYVGLSDNWHLRVGASDVLTAESGTYNIGIDLMDPEEKLDVNGAVRIGTTANTNAGTIRWTGSDFEGYDGGTWHSFTSNGGSGSLPPGSEGQTLRHNGSSWIASDFIYNDGTSVGVGTTSPPSAKLEVVGDAIATHFKLSAPTGVGPALYLNAENKDWVVYGTNSGASAGDRKFVIRDYSMATDRLTIDENGYVGLSENDPDAPLHIPGGNWDLNGTDGDLKIGDDAFRLKIGVATGGLGAGTAGIRIQGGNEKLVLGAGAAEVLWIDNTGDVTIGSETQTGQLNIYRSGVPHNQIWAFANEDGGQIYLYDDNGFLHTWLAADPDGTAGYFNIQRNAGNTGFGVMGDWNGSEEPRAWVSGSSQYVGFYMDQTGTSSVQLPSGSVSAYEIDDEAGGVSNNRYDGASSPLSGGIDVLLSRTITTPAPGFVLVIGSMSVIIVHTNGTNSIADFGVSDDSTSFAVCQDVDLELSSTLPSGGYNLPVTNHSLFEVDAAGSYTFYYLGHEQSADFFVHDVQLSLIYIPTEYGTVAPTMAGMSGTGEKGTASLPSLADIEAEQRESIAANTARIERELAELRSQVEQMKREMEMEQQNR